jgi:hypothetical protein
VDGNNFVIDYLSRFLTECKTSVLQMPSKAIALHSGNKAQILALNQYNSGEKV